MASRIILVASASTFLAASLTSSSFQGATAVSDGSSTMKALYCGMGGVGIVPVPAPPDFVSFSSVVVIEIDSVRETTHVAVNDFMLLDKQGKPVLKLKRVIGVDVFERPPITTTLHGQEEGGVTYYQKGKLIEEGIAAYYLNPGDSHAWNGTLPLGKIRLRIGIALPEPTHDFPVRFRLILGNQLLEGPINCDWPT